MDDEDFLDALEADNRNAVEPEPVKVEVVAEEPKVEEPEVLELTDPVAPPEPQAPEPMRNDEAADGRLAALLDERDKRKAAEAELQRLRDAAQANQAPIQMPDPYEDPEGFAAAQEARVSQALYQTNLRWSEQIATMKHGEETVTAAKDWGFKRCETDPYFNAKVAASPDPIGYVVTEYKRDEIASNVNLDEFAQFKAWQAAQGQIAQQAASAAPPNAASAIPPKSLASAPSAGTMLTTPVQDDEEIFNEVFSRK